MGRQLTETKVEFISLVKKGANGEPITIYKSADYSPEGTVDEVQVVPEVTDKTTEVTKTENPEEKEMKGFFQVLKDFFGGGKKETEVAKSKDLPYVEDYTSFTARITNERIKVSEAMYTLQDVMYSIFWDDSIDNGKELILKNVDEFKTYLTELFGQDATVQKSAFAKSENEEELEVKKEDLMAVIKESLGPVTQSISDLTAKVEKMEKPEEVKKEEGTEATQAAEATKPEEVQKSEELTVDVVKSLLVEALTPITKSVEELGGRVQTVEQARGISKSLESTEIKKSEAEWSGVLAFIPGTTN